MDPATGAREFGCGPSSDVHAGGYVPSPGDDAIQKFFRLKGGFLTMAVERAGPQSRMLIRPHAVYGAVTHDATLDSNGVLQARAVR